MIAAVFLLLLAAESTAGTEDDKTAVESVIASAQLTLKAKQLVRTAPEYPRLELSRAREAWVHITYCIDETGTVRNIAVLDSVGNDRFDQAAIESVQQWKFEPALNNGTPVWQSRNNVLINFALEGEQRGARPKFYRSYRKLAKLLDDDNLPEADRLFWQVYETFDLNMYELAMLWAARVRYEVKTGDMYRLDMALHRATASHGEWIEQKNYVQLLALRSKVELHLGKYREARHSFDDLITIVGDDAEAVVEMRPLFEQLGAMIESDQILKINAEVRARGDCAYCNDSWNFSPARNDFTFANINGSLRSIDMRCDNKRFESAVTDLVEWHIPDSWGTCQIQIYGDPGTTFDVLMLTATKD